MTNEKCPFINDFSFLDAKQKSESPIKFLFIDNPKIEIIKDDKKAEESSDDEKKKRGCPILNELNMYPPNKNYDSNYEINRFGPFDFIFNLRGGLSNDEFLEQSKIIRKYPRHMKYSLFHNDEKIQKLRAKEFPLIFFVFEEVKKEGSKLFKKRKFRESIDHYIYAYSMLKWIEFKDSKKKTEYLISPTLDPVLDIDIIECKAFLDDVNVQESSYKASIVFLLICLTNCYMELHHYSEAIDCLDECLTIAEDKVPDLYFRRSQARSYNKCSNDEDLQKAMVDIDKAISLKNEAIFSEHKEKLIKIQEDKKAAIIYKIEKLFKMAKLSSNKIKDRGLKLEECIFIDEEEIINQYKVLKEIENMYNLAIKFFTELKNEEQLNITYKEIENFMEIYQNFLFFYNFNPLKIKLEYIEALSEDLKNLIKDENIKYLNMQIYKLADEIFNKGNYNLVLYKFALEKVLEVKIKLKNKEKKKKQKLSFFENFKDNNIYLFISIGIILFTIFFNGASYYFSISGPRILDKSR